MVTVPWQRLFKLLGFVTVIFLCLSVLLTLPLRWFNPSTTAFMLADAAWQENRSSYQWVPREQVASVMFAAVLSAEDQRFFDHWGLDFTSIKSALGEERNRSRGASTISQQLTKNLYLWSGRSWLRKGLEAWLTVCLELFVSKQRILEIYVNVVEFGPGIYGVHQASQHFFDKSPRQLNAIDASLLAAVLPNPKNYSALVPSEYVWNRAQDIRRWMPDMALLYQEN